MAMWSCSIAVVVVVVVVVVVLLEVEISMMILMMTWRRTVEIAAWSYEGRKVPIHVTLPW